MSPALYDPIHDERSSCGVGFITRKDGKQMHEVLRLADRALCEVPHRGGMSAEGVGDGGGVCIDLSEHFFSQLTGTRLRLGEFGVGNFFMPGEAVARRAAEAAVEAVLNTHELPLLHRREIPVDFSVVPDAVRRLQPTIVQWIFGVPTHDTDALIHRALLDIEARAFTDPDLEGLHPLSFSARTQVLKGRLNSGEIMRFFSDLTNADHQIHSLFFHTRFSTNTDPRASMAQPFRLMAHNGELNTDRKNRIAETALAAARGHQVVRPVGQSDSCRFDQTLSWRVLGDDVELVEAIVSMMPPAWENDHDLDDSVRAMFEYFSLREEKNDGPAAVVFSDGTVIGARLDRLGLRPLRTVETSDYLCAMSEAGQFGFDPDTEIRRGRIEAGGMLYFDHRTGRSYDSMAAYRELASRRDYPTLVAQARVHVTAPEHAADATSATADAAYRGDLARHQRHVAYGLNAESFRFMLDPMLSTGAERVSAMGYGHAINALSHTEGGTARFLSQRFSQVTNPPLDSIREADAMSLRVALGARPVLSGDTGRQLIVKSPVLDEATFASILAQDDVPVTVLELLYDRVEGDAREQARALESAIDHLADAVGDIARRGGGIVVLTDRDVATDRPVLPIVLAIAAINRHLISSGLRLRVSLVVESGQLPSSHHVATTLGLGASAVLSICARMRAITKFGDAADAAMARFVKATEKSLLKTMGKVGLCTVESYISGEFFEPSFLDTYDGPLQRWLPEMRSPVGGVGFTDIALTQAHWHELATQVRNEDDLPMLGLFKERADGSGHSFGTEAVRGFVDLTEETDVLPGRDPQADPSLRTLPLHGLDEAFGITEEAYTLHGYGPLSPEQIDAFDVTPGYRAFARHLAEERHRRPVALRDVLGLPGDITMCQTAEDFDRELRRFAAHGNHSILVRGLHCRAGESGSFRMRLVGDHHADAPPLLALAEALTMRFGRGEVSTTIKGAELILQASGTAHAWLALLRDAPEQIELGEVEPASNITGRLASGAMSHGALVASAHESVAHGTNMVGAKSNCGEGGEHLSRYGTIRGSRIKQLASARFGVWAGYLADPMLEELEIKIAQGAKPGEGGQLPAPKVTVDIAAARGGTPGVELVSPPPHHDTYSIEDLAQLIHDCKAARVRVVVKLVSSEGIGTIAVGVAKAGADVINVAGNTGGTGAASVTSLKYAGRAAELGVAEVHQALSANGLRDAVVLRCSGAHQCAHDVLVSALLGGDSFEFGTSALMMLGCVMAKNCNVKCPAGLTTNPEAFDGDPRALAQYLLNIAHDVRELLAELGLRSLAEARGRTDLLHLLDHPAIVGRLDMRSLLHRDETPQFAHPVRVPRDFSIDDDLWERVRAALINRSEHEVRLEASRPLGNRDKSVGAQLAIDIERLLNHQRDAHQVAAALVDDRGRGFLAPGTIHISTSGSAGQSYGAFCNDGMTLDHTGTCNDGVGKGASSGTIIVHSPGGGAAPWAANQHSPGGGAGPWAANQHSPGGGAAPWAANQHSPGSAIPTNVLVGNFALFGATGGRLFVEGQAGDRFGVRNSGATAVVEGTGDFCGEYMTAGAIMNLGSFGRGLGNGMSGGFIYQYDPLGLAAGHASADSVDVGRIDDDEVHHDAALLMLQWHLEATGSELAGRLLADWDTTREHIMVLTPRAVAQYADHAQVLSNSTRSELVEELATAMARHQVDRYRREQRAGHALLDGRAPGAGLDETEQMYALVNGYTVLHTAQRLAARRLGMTDIAEPAVQDAADKLILTQNFALISALVKHACSALDGYDDAELAVLVAHHRLESHKRALHGRNVLSIDAPGTYGWIMATDRSHREAIGRLAGMEELFARQAWTDLIEVSLA